MDGETPQRPSKAVEPNAPSFKRYRGTRARIDTSPPVVPVYTVYTDSDEESDIPTGSSGESEYWTVTCPSCSCVFIPNEDDDTEEVDTRGALGTGTGMEFTTEVRDQGGHASRWSMDNRGSPEPRTTVGPFHGSRANPIRIDDDDDSNNNA